MRNYWIQILCVVIVTIVILLIFKNIPKARKVSPVIMGNTNSGANMSGAEADFVRAKISENCVVVFSKSTCPYCSSTKRLFKELGVSASVIELDRRPDTSTVQDVLQSMTGARTVPRVFINGQCIGGNSEAQSMKKSGKLEQMIKECGS